MIVEQLPSMEFTTNDLGGKLASVNLIADDFANNNALGEEFHEENAKRDSWKEDFLESKILESINLESKSILDEPEPPVDPLKSEKLEKRNFVEWKSEMMPLNELLGPGYQKTWGPSATSSSSSPVDNWSTKKSCSWERYTSKCKSNSTNLKPTSNSLLPNVQRPFDDPALDFSTSRTYGVDDSESKKCRALWRERYSLSKQNDTCSSSDESSSGDAMSLSENEEQQASNTSSRESENEQCENSIKKKKRSKRLSTTEKDEDDDSASSLASSTSCSENSFEIGPLINRSGDDHGNLNPLSPSTTRVVEIEKLSSLNAFPAESSTTTSALVSCSGKIEKRRENDNNGCGCVKIETNEGNNISVQASSRDAILTSSNQMSSLETTNKLDSPSSKEFLSLTRRNISEELSSLDTGLPQLDFEKLEKQLIDAAKEREMNQRKLMSEHVLRRLTTDTAEQPRFHPPLATKRPLKSNLGTRLQSGMNLQICFMNDAIAVDEDEDEGEWGDDEDDTNNSTVPKSKSTPNLGDNSILNKAVGRSVSNCGDSNKRASDLRKAMLERHNSEDKDFAKHQARLEEETRLMLLKAKEAARMQMEMERQKGKPTESVIEKVVGVTNLGRKKLTRLQLTKMGITQLQIILNELHSKIEVLNDELVHLLMERDSSHMEQDSMLVDIEDLLQHQRCVDLPLPDFLNANRENSSSFDDGTNINGNNAKFTRFRIFKR